MTAIMADPTKIKGKEKNVRKQKLRKGMRRWKKEMNRTRGKKKKWIKQI